MKAILRRILTRKSYSGLNIFGLALGIASAVLIFMWVEDEITFNNGFDNGANIYRIMENESYNGVPNTSWLTPGPMAQAVKTEVPGIRNAARATNSNFVSLFSIGTVSFYEPGAYIDSAFFNIFNIHFKRGDRRRAFDQTHPIVITERMALKFFPDTDPLGQLLKLDNGDLYTVTGVIDQFPANSSFTFEWAAPLELLYGRFEWLKEWDANGIATFVELEAGADRMNVDRQLHDFVKRKKSTSESTYFLFPMSDWHLYAHFTNGKPDGGGQIRYVRLFALIAFLILVIACINFMNLATARSEQRAREVGVRKTLGAGRKLLIRQFIFEALVLAMLAVVLAVVFIYLALPAFNSLVGKILSFRIMDPLHMGGLISIGIFSGLLAGSYPAFYLSSFNPAEVLKGLKVTGSIGAAFTRKGLVIGQFTVSITLIICTIIIYQQIQHAKNRDLGYDRDRIIFLNLHGDMQAHFGALKTDLVNSGAVDNAALSVNPTHRLGWFSSDGFSWQGKNPDNEVLITIEGVSPEFLSTTGMKLKEGRDFYSRAESDINNVIINETLAGLMGSGSPVGAEIVQGSGPGNEWRMRVIGVVRNFMFGNIYGASTEPMILLTNPGTYNYLTVRLKEDGDLQERLATVSSIMRRNFPDYPFSYNFLDDEFDKLFKTERLIETLASTFAGLAIAISCLGLFGLASYTAARRRKEISIRKVLGATVGGITGMLSMDFLKLVAVACVFAFPAAWWFMSDWLSNYEYRTPIHWWVFGMAGLCALCIALFTVSFQTIRAALTNPALSLRSE